MDNRQLPGRLPPKAEQEAVLQVNRNNPAVLLIVSFLNSRERFYREVGEPQGSEWPLKAAYRAGAAEALRHVITWYERKLEPRANEESPSEA